MTSRFVGQWAITWDPRSSVGESLGATLFRIGEITIPINTAGQWGVCSPFSNKASNWHDANIIYSGTMEECQRRYQMQSDAVEKLRLYHEAFSRDITRIASQGTSLLDKPLSSFYDTMDHRLREIANLP